MTDMFFADNAISTKAVQKCQPFCPIYKRNWHHFIISSTGRRPASLCHGPSSVRPCVLTSPTLWG